MLDHLGVQVADLEKSAAFYQTVLAPLGGGELMNVGVAIGYGIDRPTFWISKVEDQTPSREAHIAFIAADRAQVVAFSDAAVGFGAQVLHEPRVFPEYHPSYYGAFVRDPDGNNVEAVCHAPE